MIIRSENEKHIYILFLTNCIVVVIAKVLFPQSFKIRFFLLLMFFFTVSVDEKDENLVLLLMSVIF